MRVRQATVMMLVTLIGTLVARMSGAGEVSDGDWVVFDDPSYYDEAAHALAVGNGFLVVVGSDGTDDDRRWRTEKRSIVDGSLDPGFGEGGVVTSNPTPLDEHAKDVAVAGDAVYVAGFESGGSADAPEGWRLEKYAS